MYSVSSRDHESVSTIILALLPCVAIITKGGRGALVCKVAHKPCSQY